MEATTMKFDPKVIIALDGIRTMEGVSRFVEYVSPQHCLLKVGKELFTALGPAVVVYLQQLGFKVFLDLKLHDIPNTVVETCKVIAGLGVYITNVHASGGRKMMEDAVDAMSHFSIRPKLIAVTVLTSMDAVALEEVGIPKEKVLLPVDYFTTPEAERVRPMATTASQVLRLALLAKDCGMDGVVSSAQEAAMLRKQCGNDFCLVTPGIRPAGANANDQVRIATPGGAIKSGSNYLVIGRPITEAENPTLALQLINQEISPTAI